MDSILGPKYSLDFNGPKGFGGVSVDPDAGLVTFAWKGEPSARVARKLASPPEGVSVTVTQARYTQARLNVASDRLAKRQIRKRLRRSTGWSLVVLSPDQTGSGLDAEVVPVRGAAQDSLGSARGAFSTAADVAVTVTEGERAFLAQGPRWKPKSPWRGGAALMTPLGDAVCSSGIAGIGSGGEKVFLTAGHCGENKSGGYGGTYYAKNGNTWKSKGPKFGDVWGTLPEHDTGLVGITGGYGARFYTGSWNAPKSKYKTVGSAGESKKGEKVCTSGAMSGVHCKLNVTKTNATVFPYGPLGPSFSPMVIAVASSGIAVAQGDSGGPVFKGKKNHKAKKRQVRGIISMWFVSVKCPSIAIPKSGLMCGKKVAFAPIKRALSDFSVKLVKQ
ncbi:MAG: hypothetical protein Q8Q52_02455 [Acidimicrobiia bacterium]|nr:hypothetical protein [Acidimicrobiia bacterium]